VLPDRQEVSMSRLVNRRNTRASAPAVVATLALLVSLVLPSAAWAQAPGVRAGVSVDPDQFYFGGHFESGPLIEALHFKPNIEVGFGDRVTHLGLNFEFVYKFPTDRDWTLYAGGGPAMNVFSFRDFDGRETEAGMNLVFGAETDRGLFFEVKVGALDSPDLKFAVGWTFR
jgi:hypothetical protein